MQQAQPILESFGNAVTMRTSATSAKRETFNDKACWLFWLRARRVFLACAFFIFFFFFFLPLLFLLLVYVCFLLLASSVSRLCTLQWLIRSPQHFGRNNNSSRFGKYNRVFFDETGTLVDASVSWKLMECERHAVLLPDDSNGF